MTPRHNTADGENRTRKAKEVDFGFSFGGPTIDEPSVLDAAPPQATPPAESQRSTRRTPGSARNNLPERPSTYDIPADDVPEQTRSAKRRRISTDTTTRQSPARPKTGTSATQEAGKSNTLASVSHVPEVVAINPPKAAPTKQQPPSSQIIGAESATNPSQETQPTVQSPPKAKQARGRPRKSQSPNLRPQAKALQDTISSPKRTRQTPNSQSKAGPSRRRSASETRPQAGSEANAETSRTTREPKAGAAIVAEGKRPRGRPARTVDGDDSTQTAEDVAREQETSKPKRGRGRPSTSGKARESLSRPEAPTEPTPTPAESSAPKGRGRKSASKKTVEEPVPSPSPETQSDLSAPKRGRPSGKKANRAPEPEPEEEQAEDEDRSEVPRRRARSPRGETVPITVHRLANASAWGGTDSPVDEEEESADELSTLQKTKLPNRGGVNPADVLSQICRETLEKTLETLKTGIASETNATRRAEWTRKRKAVEAFGAELDGRLLDLSEMLDSNFVLGVQLKKSKREMLDLRSHLYHVRKEREDIALQMDAVRAKHMEEENAKSTRTAINNSLHTLELALDRTQQRTTTTTSTNPSSVDVEFMLRAVADDVSCLAPGAQGGLLTQLRTFNAQLEATARRLES
ncbi:hypothetical protein N7510_011533 [Penicillium lagena]|uniref:uncharacterized protein n=1 Tax=Penicillium lagena TaxID=94218 RepID=UPI0025422465|nr:uncharacterized protein N7510_011533 [Penicillium lagena]KAJ5601999.1 hypothetical protein N7510_011533 [Penicillium lagena]